MPCSLALRSMQQVDTWGTMASSDRVLYTLTSSESAVCKVGCRATKRTLGNDGDDKKNPANTNTAARQAETLPPHSVSSYRDETRQV